MLRESFYFDGFRIQSDFVVNGKPAASVKYDNYSVDTFYPAGMKIQQKFNNDNLHKINHGTCHFRRGLADNKRLNSQGNNTPGIEDQPGEK